MSDYGCLSNDQRKGYSQYNMLILLLCLYFSYLTSATYFLGS